MFNNKYGNLCTSLINKYQIKPHFYYLLTLDSSECFLIIYLPIRFFSTVTIRNGVCLINKEHRTTSIFLIKCLNLEFDKFMLTVVNVLAGILSSAALLDSHHKFDFEEQFSFFLVLKTILFVY